MEVSVSGLKEEGDWDEIVDHGKEITRVLEEKSVPEDELEDWNEWRPKRSDSLDTDITEKTAEKASVNEGEGEQNGTAPTEDLKNAGKKATSSTSNLKEASKKAPKDPGDAADRVSDAGGELQDSAGHFARAVDTLSRKFIRPIEVTVYKRLMTRVSPYYFDNTLVSANIRQKGSFFSDEQNKEYVFEVNINDDELKKDVADELTSDE